MSSTYNWIITTDHLDESANGVEGPHGLSIHADNQTLFRMYDDDGILYYSGKIWGDFDGFEPLDDFGTPNAGCTWITLKDNKTGIFKQV